MSKSDKHNTKHVGDAIRELLHHYQIQSKFDEASLIASWERLLGKSVARHTRKVFIRNKVLFVEMDSASLKNDLNLHKPRILALFEREFGPDRCKEIVIM
jgi:predicted nucleic acid-binding Zn ribbon protein